MIFQHRGPHGGADNIPLAINHVDVSNVQMSTAAPSPWVYDSVNQRHTCWSADRQHYYIHDGHGTREIDPPKAEGEKRAELESQFVSLSLESAVHVDPTIPRSLPNVRTTGTQQTENGRYESEAFSANQQAYTYSAPAATSQEKPSSYHALLLESKILIAAHSKI